MSKTTIAGLLLLLLILMRVFWPASPSAEAPGDQREDDDGSFIPERPIGKDILSLPESGASSEASSAVERRRAGSTPPDAGTHQGSDDGSGGTPSSLDSGLENPDRVNLSGAKPMEQSKKFEIKKFSADEIMALPLKDKTTFLDKNKLRNPDDFERFQRLPEVAVIDSYLKGQYQGKLEDKDGREWTLVFGIDGQLEDDHFTGEMAIEILNQANEPVGRSSTSGPLDSHFRVVEEGDKYSLLITPGSRDNSKMYQIFISPSNKSMLAGNYYRKDENGKFQISGPFVLKRF